MSVIKYREFRTTQDAQQFLQGVVLFEYQGLKGNGLIPGMVGKTLVFTQPAAATCTFVAGVWTTDPTALSYLEIKTQLEAAIPGLRVFNDGNRLCLIQASPTFGAGVNITGGTALSILGGTAPIQGKVFQTSGGAPQLLSAYGTVNSHVVVTLE